MKTCKTCRYGSFDNELHGNCYRYAPRPVVWGAMRDEDDPLANLAVWPQIGEDDWCGEWEAKDDDDNRA